MAYLCDANIYINAHREENSNHDFYHQWLTKQLEGNETFFYSDLVLSAFIRIVTNSKIYKTPTPLDQAIAFIESVKSQPNAVKIVPGDRHWSIFKQLCLKSKAAGNLIPDAYLAALAIEANAVWISADKDFRKFEPTLTWRCLLSEQSDRTEA